MILESTKIEGQKINILAEEETSRPIYLTYNMDEIGVSVYCLAYNHEKYIQDALEGFVNQKTSFKYEVIVHDDASNDSTALIIKDYEKKYPEIIKGIYQNENQYSQGIQIFDKLISPQIKGKYIAMCEGDDCWIDENKLQRQFDALEEHPECDMCAHRAKWFDCTKNRTTGIFPGIFDERVLRAEEVIYGEGGLLPTASLFYRNDIRLNPMSFQKIWSIDYTLQIRGALRGGIYFIPETMALYRWKTDGSWTTRNDDIKSQIALNQRRAEMLLELDKETSGRYKDVIEKRLKKNEFIISLKRHDNRTIFKKENIEFLIEFTLIGRMIRYIKACFSFLNALYRKVNGRK